MCYVQSSIYKTVNSNAKLNTDFANHDKLDGTWAKGCDYKMNNGGRGQ